MDSNLKLTYVKKTYVKTGYIICILKKQSCSKCIAFFNCKHFIYYVGLQNSKWVKDDKEESSFAI